MSTKRINDLLNLANVQRWHSVPTLRKPSVAEHSYRVAVIAMELAAKLNLPTGLRYEILHWALMHDGPETETGDLPHTTKVRLPVGLWQELEAQLCPWYAPPSSASAICAIVKLADLMECWLFIDANKVSEEGRNAATAARRELSQLIVGCAQWWEWTNLHAIVTQILDSAGHPSDTRHVYVIDPVPMRSLKPESVD